MGFVFGLFKGLIKELTSLVAILLSIYGAKLFAPFLVNILTVKFHFIEKTAYPIAYFILFVAIITALLLLAKMLDKVLDSIALGGLNKFLGGLFGALKYALIISVLLNIFDALDRRFSIVSQRTKIESIAYKPLIKFGPTLWEETKKSKTFDSSKEDTENRNK